MSRYFIEVAYKGTRYSGFQVQENANTIQSEIEKAFTVLHRKPITLTGSSRTDAGVHALQNYFHFDFEEIVNPAFVYKMNAILPADIVVKAIYSMPDNAHSRFDAVSREYIYKIHRFKSPFLNGTSLFYPFKLDVGLMKEAANMVLCQTNFQAFSKTNTQVKNFKCQIVKCDWIEDGEQLMFNVESNRFVRGMVRLLVGSMLRIGRSKLSIQTFENFFIKDIKSGYSAPSEGLFLKRVSFPENYFPATAGHFTRF